MRYIGGCLAVLMLASATLAADDDVKPQDLRKLYNETLVQLRAAQDRKAELASENERMAMRATELEKEIRFDTAQLDDLKRQNAGWAERTYFLRTNYAAWQQFLQLNPGVRTQWVSYLEKLTPLSPIIEAPFIDMHWPLPDAGF